MFILFLITLGSLSISHGSRLPFIIGGEDATPGKWPWTGLLQDEAGRFRCGCVLLSDIWAATAVHCVVQEQAYTVKFGVHDRVTEEEGDPQEYMVQQVIRHEDYWVGDIGDYHNDFALLRLASPADVSSEFISPIALPDADDDFDDQLCWIAGWGRTVGTDPGSSPNILQEVEVQVYNWQVCYIHWHGGHVDDSGVCVGKPGSIEGACFGDSGGPLHCEKENGEWVLVGLTSWGSDTCYHVDSSTVYARVTYFREWIRENAGI